MRKSCRRSKIAESSPRDMFIIISATPPPQNLLGPQCHLTFSFLDLPLSLAELLILLQSVECAASGTMSIILLVSTFFTTSCWLVYSTFVDHCVRVHIIKIWVSTHQIYFNKISLWIHRFQSFSFRQNIFPGKIPLGPIFFSVLFWVPLGYPLQNIFTYSP